MTNRQFWDKLERLSSQESTVETVAEFIRILRAGYQQDLQILVGGVIRFDDPNCFNQCCFLTEKGEKSMIYYTNRKHFRKKFMNLPVLSTTQAECIEANVKEMIDNALNKKEVTALYFNPKTKNELIIPKKLLQFMFLHDTI